MVNFAGVVTAAAVPGPLRSNIELVTQPKTFPLHVNEFVALLTGK